MSHSPQHWSGLYCFVHNGRPASARCPRCRRLFCRVCVTEHGGRLLCAECLRQAEAYAHPPAGRFWRRARAAAAVLLALICLGVVVWFAGLVLRAIPAQWHEATPSAAPEREP